MIEIHDNQLRNIRESRMNFDYDKINQRPNSFNIFPFLVGLVLNKLNISYIN